MRRFFLAATILSIVAGGPLQAQAGDREIAEQIIQKLKVQRDAGTLKDFTLDLKVDKGVVLMRGSVREPAQKEGVLAAAKGIEGIANVVDEISISSKVATATPTAPTADATATVVRPKATIATAEPAKAPVASTKTTKSSDAFSFKQALAATKTGSPEIKTNTAKNTEVKTDVVSALAPTSSPSPSAVTQANSPAHWAPIGGVEMAAATESSVESDRAITSAVVASLGNAQRQGRLKGFGVDVNTQDGRVYVNGRASSEAHRELINDLVRKTPGVVEVIDEIAVYDSTSSMPLPLADNSSNEPLPLADYAPNLTPVNVEPVDRATRGGTPAMAVSNRMGVPAQTAPYPMQQGAPMQAMPAGMPMHGGVMGAPVPMAPYAGGAAAPRYEQPYLPNYAWPGYAAYPNYAAVTYPQQYSPSAWPYIGPFYPYPQVPLGWRKVSLEWDDGWWFLDFTDK